LLNDEYKTAQKKGYIGSAITPFNPDGKLGSGVYQEIDAQDMVSLAKRNKITIFHLIVPGCQPAASSIKNISSFADSLQKVSNTKIGYNNVSLYYSLGQIYGLYQLHQTKCFYILSTKKGKGITKKLKAVNDYFGNKNTPYNDLFIFDSNGVLLTSIDAAMVSDSEVKRVILALLK
jgi:hypothetical protein